MNKHVEADYVMEFMSEIIVAFLMGNKMLSVPSSRKIASFRL